MCKKKKQTAMLIVAAMLTSFILGVMPCKNTEIVYAQEKQEEQLQKKYAEFIFDKKIKTTNIGLYYFGETGGFTLEEEAGLMGVWLRKQSNYLYLNVDDKYWYSKEAEPVAVTVEYVDSGSGCFTIRRTSPAARWDDSADIVKMEDTGEIKTHTFYCDDMILNNQNNNADVVIAAWSQKMGMSPAPVFIHSVRLEQINQRQPIKISGDMGKYGLIYSADDDDKMDIIFENISDLSVDGKYTWEVTDQDGNSISNGDGDFTAGPKSEYRKNIRTGVTKFGVYYLKVKLDGSYMGSEGLYEFENVRNIHFSKALTWEKGDERNDYFFINTHISWYDHVKGPHVVARSGVGGIRDSYGAWITIESKPKEYAFKDSETNNVLKDYGLKVLTTTYGNTLYPNEGEKANQVAVPRGENIKAMKEYAEWAAANLPENYVGIELWNEWNNPPAFNVNGGTAQEYAELMKEIYPAFKKANPNMVFVVGSTLGADTGWLDKVFAEDTIELCDAVSIHPYSWGGGRLANSVNASIGTQKLIEKYNAKKPVWITELGWHDTELWHGMTSLQQAEMIVKSPLSMLAHGAADKYIWYDFQDDGENLDSMESRFGTVESNVSDNPLSAKPSYVALCAMNKIMPNAKPLGIIENDTMSYSIYNFKRTVGDNVAVMWTMKGNETVSVRLGCESVEMFDMYGNNIGKIYGDNGVFTFNLGERQIYVTGKFTDFEKTESPITVIGAKSACPNDVFSLSIHDSKKRNYIMEIDSSLAKNKINVSDKTDIIEGEGKITLTTGSKMGVENQLWITLKDKERTVYKFPIDIDVGDPIGTKVSSDHMSVTNDNIWYTILDVTNLAGSNHISGTAEIVAPLDYAKAAKPVRFDDLAPGKTKRIYFNSPKLLKKRASTITVKIVLDDGFTSEVSGKQDFTCAYYSKSKPTVDGIVSPGEWDSGFWVYSDRQDDYTATGNTDWNGINDLSFRAKFKYDEDNFYMLAIVKDDIFRQDKDAQNQWVGDGIQFGFEDMNSKSDGSNTSYTELGFALVEGKPAIYRWSSLYNKPSGTVENGTAAILRNDAEGETVYELAIPWSEIFKEDYVLDDTYCLGFSMLVNDNDGEGRKGFMQYNDGIGVQKNSSLFGKMQMMREGS